ncbi:hypothetical protein EYF80_067041 [Liparis tanakae]|uniref:Uncharacterized protein n=1 Tax=Liparis tanakae TaxID=230148 RepID=A0A4Z2E279_9TELE|nr:hypothetical protein EYF80_067041 [Liparis tanakae]
MFLGIAWLWEDPVAPGAWLTSRQLLSQWAKPTSRRFQLPPSSHIEVPSVPLADCSSPCPVASQNSGLQFPVSSRHPELTPS